ncbi:MAG: hypothetical protein K8S14_08360 [Actinomycetia bacterium]|nr:hypothetical protein [Actinomycetes bacterium]
MEKYEAKRMSPPDLRLVKRCFRDNNIYRDNAAEVVFSATTDDDAELFEISLSAKKKGSDVSFRVETRIALEQHSISGHKHPHLQINNFASDEELMKKGTLHIHLLVQSPQELEECCNGFVYNIGGILELIEEAFEIKINLKEHFFYLEPFEKLGMYGNKLHELICRTFRENKLNFEEDEIELVQFKGKKNEQSLDTTDMFKILRILLQLKFLNPILLDPILHLIIEENSQIKSKCPNLKLEDCKKKLLAKSMIDLQYYTREVFIKEFKY